MSYQVHVWRTKEVIQAKNLNHLENGIYNEEQRALEAEQELRDAIDASAIGQMQTLLAEIDAAYYLFAEY